MPRDTYQKNGMNERKFVTCPVLEELPVSGARGLSLDGIHANGEHVAS